MRSYIESLEGLSKQQLILMLARKRHEETEPVAIVGMSCRFPGGIDSPDAFWRALLDGRVVPEESAGAPVDSRGRPRWNTRATDIASLAELLDKGAYLDGIDLFDAGYFGIPDDEAARLDPQHRLLLMCAAEAMADANLTRAELSDRRVGVYVGVTSAEYGHAALRNGMRPDVLSAHMLTGSVFSGASGRVALGLRLNGPALTIDTACSSALVALHLACGALRRRECDLAVIGVANLIFSPWTTASFEKTGVLSPSGRTRPLAADADGYVRAEGCGVLVLARGDAAGGSAPYAFVRGTAVDQHGDRMAMTMVSGVAQQRVITSALAQAGLDPAAVQYVEAQANGSALAGRIEMEALATAYRRRSPDAPPLHIGSCKANLGYLETASGIAGLIKAALAVGHAEMPPQVGLDELDPGVPWEQWSIDVPRKTTPWPAGARRLAGVSAAGFTGTCAHAVLEAAPEREPAGDLRQGAVGDTPHPGAVGDTLHPGAVGDTPHPGEPAELVLSAHTVAALQATAARLHAFLLARPELCHTEVCRTLAVGRDLQAVRHTAVVTDRAELLAELAAASVGVPTSATRSVGRPAPQASGAAQSREHLHRLPPNAFDCRSYWPDEYRWS